MVSGRGEMTRLSISVITPTADRPIGFALAERWMARQTLQPDEWIVADGGLQSVRCTMGQRHLHVPAPHGPRNFLGNLVRGLAHARGDVIVWWEDDDWYAPTHLERLVAQMGEGVLAAGDDLQQYYNVPNRVWRQFNNQGASLCQTAFRRELSTRFTEIVQRCHQANGYGVDAKFWAVVPRRARSLQRHQTVIGMKGLPGQSGLGIGHRPEGPWRRDPEYTQLREWIGADVDVYAALGPAPCR